MSLPLVKIAGSEEWNSQVATSRTPVVADFYGDWCVPCKALLPVLEDLHEKYYPRLKFVRVDVTNNIELANAYSIRGVPSVLFIANGQVRGEMRSSINKQSLRQKIDETFQLG